MGLFSFLKNAGAKLFGKKEAAPAAPTTNTAAIDDVLRKQQLVLLRGVVDSMHIPVQGLNIDLHDDIVTISGTVETTEQKEKIILALGNVNGIAFVDDRLTATNPAPAAVFYEVKSGDTLSKIAKVQYGDMMRYNEIFEANRPMLEHPDKIYPGQILRIPKVEGTYSSSMNTYEVQSGDTLGKIAKEQYGDASKYTIIFEANRSFLSNPDNIKVGQILSIPPMA